MMRPATQLEVLSRGGQTVIPAVVVNRPLPSSDKAVQRLDRQVRGGSYPVGAVVYAPSIVVAGWYKSGRARPLAPVPGTPPDALDSAGGESLAEPRRVTILK
jgi:hypothetical protein